jgi:transposase
MLRSQTVLTIHDLHTQEKTVQEIAQELHISRTTVRKYLKHPEAVIPKPRPPRSSKLDPYKEQIKKWVMEDHCTNCEVLFERLQKLGYTGGISILKEYVHPLRPAVAGHAPVQRYETKPGEQVQFDWGEFVYEHEGKTHKFYGFTAILGYSRMRFVTFVKRCDTPTLIRCLMEAFEYFGGLTKVALTDRMKSVLLEMEENKPRWNPRFADFMVSIGVAARVCKPYTPQTKGKVERTVSHVKKSLWGGVTFTDLDDLNRQAYAWCERINARVHRTTHVRPLDRLAEEQLLPLPQDFAWERFATEERKVTWDGYVSYDGVLYGLPATLQLAGKQVQVRERKGVVSIWSAGKQVFEIAKRPRSQESVPHADQWKTVASVSAVRRAPTPLGHLQPAPDVQSRPLQEYDQYCGVETLPEVVA